MSVVRNLLAAQERRDAERVTAAVAERLRDLNADNTAETVAAAAAAYRKATVRRVQRPAPRNGVGFGDPVPDPTGDFVDAPASPTINVRLDPHFLLAPVAEPAEAEWEPPLWCWVALAVGAVGTVVALVLVGIALVVALGR